MLLTIDVDTRQWVWLWKDSNIGDGFGLEEEWCCLRPYVREKLMTPGERGQRRAGRIRQWKPESSMVLCIHNGIHKMGAFL